MQQNVKQGFLLFHYGASLALRNTPEPKQEMPFVAPFHSLLIAELGFAHTSKHKLLDNKVSGSSWNNRRTLELALPLTVIHFHHKDGTA